MKTETLKQKLDEMRELYTEALNRHDGSEKSFAGVALRKAIKAVETELSNRGIQW